MTVLKIHTYLEQHYVVSSITERAQQYFQSKGRQKLNPLIWKKSHNVPEYNSYKI
jgi:hypothetical protein